MATASDSWAGASAGTRPARSEANGADTSSWRTPSPCRLWAIASACSGSPAWPASWKAWRRHSTSSSRLPPWWAISPICSHASAVIAPCRPALRALAAASPIPRRAKSRPMGLNSRRASATAPARTRSRRARSQSSRDFWASWGTWPSASRACSGRRDCSSTSARASSSSGLRWFTSRPSRRCWAAAARSFWITHSRDWVRNTWGVLTMLLARSRIWLASEGFCSRARISATSR